MKTVEYFESVLSNVIRVSHYDSVISDSVYLAIIALLEEVIELKQKEGIK